MSEQAENMSGQEKENIADQAMDSLGIPEEAQQASSEGEKGQDDSQSSIQKRLGKQAERHRKEMRMMQEQLHELQSKIAQPQEEQQPSDPYGQSQGGDVNDQISKAVAAALRAKDEHEREMARQRAEKERQEHMQKQYQSLNDSFDKASEKYEDFDDVVRHPEAPFTPAMRDYALTLDNAADVLYKLGKNPEELKRISKLPAIQQAREMSKLSFALMGGGSKPQQEVKPMGQIKGSPVASHAVNEKTSVSDIRQRMKSGGWK